MEILRLSDLHGDDGGVAARHADLLAAWQTLAADRQTGFEDPAWRDLAEAWEDHVLSLSSGVLA